MTLKELRDNIDVLITEDEKNGDLEVYVEIDSSDGYLYRSSLEPKNISKKFVIETPDMIKGVFFDTKKEAKEFRDEVQPNDRKFKTKPFIFIERKKVV